MKQILMFRKLGDGLKRRLARTSLKNLLLWLFIPVFVVCILVNLLVTNVLVRSQVKENALVSISELVVQTKQHLDYRLYGLFEQMVLFEQSPDVAALVANVDESEPTRRQRFVKIFNDLERIYFTSYSALDTVFVAIQQGRKPINVFYKSDYPPARSDFSFSTVLNQEALLTQSGKSYQWLNLHENVINPNVYTDNRVASLYKVIGDENSTSRCLFLFNFKNDFFEQVFGEIKVTENGYFALVGDGVAMSFGGEREIPPLNSEALKIIEAETGSPGRLTYKNDDGSEILAVWEPLQLGSWKLAAVFPEADLMSSVNKIRLITIVCSFLAIAIALVLSLLIIRVISNPISKWVHKISDACSESTDILLDDAICAEIVELNGGISHLMDKVRSLMKEKLVEERKKRELEIRILHEQIKPHFLYNALYSIEQLGYLGEFDKVTKIIKSLNGFYRLSLSKGRDVIELKDEIAHAEYYLTIQMIRSKRVSCAVKVDRELLSAKIVKLSLQPLLENALFHGAKHGEDLHLNIEAKKTDSGIKIEVSDDGAGMDFEKVAALQRAFATDDWTALPEVYGIRNVHERIRLHYGPAYGLTIESVLEQGTLVTIFVPESKE